MNAIVNRTVVIGRGVNIRCFRKGINTVYHDGVEVFSGTMAECKSFCREFLIARNSLGKSERFMLR